jgi:uncharacterized protein (TIGR03084 family)
MVSMAELDDDLAAESADLRALLAGLEDPAWDTPTPAPGWSVRDQVSHLAYFDDAARRAIAEPDLFAVERADALPDVDGLTARVAAEHRHLRGDQLLDWWSRAQSGLVSAAGRHDPSDRVAWIGPSMSVASLVTSRLMETWAHGQDVADALGVERRPTDRLRHVVFLGVRALPHSFSVQGWDVPREPVRVEVVSPSGQRWTYGPEGTADRVTGSALDFALAVTRRRHLDDLDLVVTGPVATRWMAVAQAYAGPPGAGRQPGQYRQPAPGVAR